MSQNHARGFAVSTRNHNCGLTWHALVTTTLHNLPSQPPFATMPVTIKTAPHGANKFRAYNPPAKNADTFFSQDATYRRLASKTVASCFTPTDTVYMQKNGFV